MTPRDAGSRGVPYTPTTQNIRDRVRHSYSIDCPDIDGEAMFDAWLSQHDGRAPGTESGRSTPPRFADSQRVVRLTVNLAPSVASALQDLAALHQASITDTVRLAVIALGNETVKATTGELPTGERE